MANDFTNRLRTWQQAGWEVEKSRGGHMKLIHKDASTPVFCASTPSDHRAIMNMEAELRRALGQRPEKPIKSDLALAVPVKKNTKSSPSIRKPLKFYIRYQPETKIAPEEPICSLFDQTNSKLRADVWRLCYLRLRLDHRDISTIHVIKRRIQIDDEFFRMSLNSFNKVGIIETAKIRSILRTRNRVEVVLPEMVIEEAEVATVPIKVVRKRRTVRSGVSKNGIGRYAS